MAYRIPSTEVVREALRRVLSRNRGVSSLSELTELVAEELQEEDPRYRLGTERLRRIATRMNAVRTTIYTRRGGSTPFASDCPVCGASLERVRNRTLTGADVALESRCTACPYWTGRDRRVPIRYAFHVREWRFGDPKSTKKRPERRIDMSAKNPKRL